MGTPDFFWKSGVWSPAVLQIFSGNLESGVPPPPKTPFPRPNVWIMGGGASIYIYEYVTCISIYLYLYIYIYMCVCIYIYIIRGARPGGEGGGCVDLAEAELVKLHCRR